MLAIETASSEETGERALKDLTFFEVYLVLCSLFVIKSFLISISVVCCL